MKITIVQGAFLPVPPVLGGAVEKVWFALGREFAARGHEVTHISRRYGDLPARERVDGVEHIRIAGFDTPRSLVQLKALDFIYSCRVVHHLPPADILVTNTFWLPLLVRDCVRGKLYVHVARFPKGQMRFYSRAARLQTVSRPVAAAIEQEAPQFAARVRVVPYPLIDVDSGTEEPAAGREKQVLFVGRIHPEKGLHLLIQAFASIPLERLANWRLVLVGPAEVRLGGGGDKYLSQLHALAAPIADRVDWVGPVFDTSQLAALYRQAAVFSYPSLADRGETFGLAPLEAMAHGCAPVVSDLACFRDFIQDRLDGLVFNHLSPQPEKHLANRLQELMRDDGYRLRMGEAARRKAEQYSLDRIAPVYLEDFASLLRQATGSTPATTPCVNP